MNGLAERARQIGNQYYPEVLDLLVEKGTQVPRQFDLVFKPHLWQRQLGEKIESVAYTQPLRRRVYFNANMWGGSTNNAGLGSDPVMLQAVLIHEMAHVAEQYRSKAPTYWAEGIADYACFKLGYTNGAFCPECSEDLPSYYFGYRCAGAFLLYLDSIYGSDLVRQLNAQLRNETYSDAFFLHYTGMSLEALWTDFQKTPAFEPVAARVNQFQKSLGYVGGRPPKDFATRFEAYIRRQPGTAEILARLRAAKEAGKPIKNAETLTQMYVYFTEPGGSALSFLLGLKKGGELPGISKTDHGFTNPAFLIEKSPTVYPVAQTLHLRKLGDSSLYHYTVDRTSAGAPWKLERAWRTDDRGNLLQEFPMMDSN